MGFKKKVSRQSKVQRVYANKSWKPAWKLDPARILGTGPPKRSHVSPEPYPSKTD